MSPELQYTRELVIIIFITENVMWICVVGCAIEFLMILHEEHDS